ncbi:MAG: UDP-N-acetylmuramate--L-alanine ligase [Phycisphaerae bacterium]
MLTVQDLVHTLKPRTTRSPFTGRHVHFVGIGGSGMCGLAHMLLDLGAVVSGTDRTSSAVTAKLSECGATLRYEQVAGSMPADVEIVVHSAAIKPEHPELIEARRRGADGAGVEILKYAQMLGRVMALRHGIAIAGTHGKSTTTALLAHILLSAGLDPSFVVGATSAQLGGSARSGNGDFFVAEACEYDRSFHNLHPQMAAVLNIEEDHLDYYKDLAEIIASFGQFMSQVDPSGVILTSATDENCRQAARQAKARVETYGVDTAADWQAVGIRRFQGKAHFAVNYRGKLMGRLALGIAGRHNVGNALVAAALATQGGVSWEQIAAAVESFRGADRRSQLLLTTPQNVRILDDYGHHPTEVRATLLALREHYRPERLVCVFQPHQHSRTRFLLDDFARSFVHADLTIVPDIYFVRDSEADRKAVNSAMLVEKIVANGRAAKYIADFPAIVEYVLQDLRPGDLIVSMGAGPVWEVTDELVRRLGR